MPRPARLRATPPPMAPSPITPTFRGMGRMISGPMRDGPNNPLRPLGAGESHMSIAMFGEMDSVGVFSDTRRLHAGFYDDFPRGPRSARAECSARSAGYFVCRAVGDLVRGEELRGDRGVCLGAAGRLAGDGCAAPGRAEPRYVQTGVRPEERRVGKEWFRTVSTRWE